MGHTGSRQAGWRKVDDDRVDEGAAPFPFHAMLTSLAFACMGRHRPAPHVAKHVGGIHRIKPACKPLKSRTRKANDL